MKKFLSFLVFAIMVNLSSVAQTLMVPENDSLFTTEYRNDQQWAIVHKDSLVIGISNKIVHDDYGKFYQLDFQIINLTDQDFNFEPANVKATIYKEDFSDSLKVYTAEKLQRKIKNSQAWAAALYGLSAGINSGLAASQDGYNSGNAYTANMVATTQLMFLDDKFKADLRMRDIGYLKKNTIHPSNGISGYMMVGRKKGSKMVVSFPVNGKMFHFMWDVKKKKKG